MLVDKQKSNVLVIAEAGVNHNGSLERALEMVEVAAAAGADYVKFQTFQAAAIVSADAPKADYQARLTGTQESQLEMLRQLELSRDDHLVLQARCREHGIRFLSTPFDLSSLHLLCNELALDTIKLPSGELTNAPLLMAAARSGCQLIVSTGMAYLEEVEAALAVLAFGLIEKTRVPAQQDELFAAYRSEAGRQALREKVVLLHCTTEYPAPYESINLRAMDTLHSAFGLPVGLSDHSAGIAIPIAAAARGACVIEKHFTLDRRLPGPDHQASLEPAELKAAVAGIRAAELALGDGNKQPATVEQSNRLIARKSLVAARAIKAGEILSADVIAIKRPGNGISPMCYWNVLGQLSDRDYCPDEPLSVALQTESGHR